MGGVPSEHCESFSSVPAVTCTQAQDLQGLGPFKKTFQTLHFLVAHFLFFCNGRKFCRCDLI